MMLERDTGFVTDESMMLKHLKLMLSGDYMDDSDFDSDDDDDDDDSDDGLSLLACMMWVMLLNASVHYGIRLISVSYTHLTLPTIYSV